MRRLTTLAVAAAVAAASIAAPALAKSRHDAAPQVGAAQPGYYVIRWDNTGICQVWNEDLRYKPFQWGVSTYKVVSKPFPTFTQASELQIKLRGERRCTL